ncbi:MAG: hypothetical protein QNJ22_11415 [Desulfosarcinaceae bacterium]|nr:hypothetical protein [Desulfosarcinaceae bacterium]
MGNHSNTGKKKPKGSGKFAVFCAGLFLLLFAGSFIVPVDKIPPEWAIRAWLFFAGAVLMYWGCNRITNGRDDPTVGQGTINLVIGIFAATVALLSLLKTTP